MTLRGALSRMVDSSNLSPSDRVVVQDVLSAEGFPALPGMLFAAALAAYADTAPLAEADALSPLVVSFGPVPTIDLPSIDAEHLGESLLTLVGDAVGLDEHLSSGLAELAADADIYEGFTALQSQLALESQEALAASATQLDLDFGAGAVGHAGAPVSETADPFALDALAVESASTSAAIDPSIVGDDLDLLDGLDDAVLSAELVDGDVEGVERWDAEYRGISAADPDGEDPADLGLDDF